ncbi:enoyl-CoA hydratase-related protein [Paraburkholderia sp. RL17-347-BIC-D]|uniref:enoyl-CoA hydratase-related protein n=1 Tax=Paraburkholderia sp. RL17-347-BIC-D TaxID=3031632 RepID=UPI0038BAC591
MTNKSTFDENFTTIECVVDETGVARVTLSRPDVHNAFNEAMIDELTRCFLQLASHDDVRVIVLASLGKVFCAGADLNWMKRASANNADANLQDAQRFARMMQALHACSKPIVARVQGGAFGGGVGLICACDIVVASEQARFAVTEARFGILPAVIGPYLIEAVGVRQARRLALTASLIGAAEAHDVGLVHYVTTSEGLNEQVQTVVSGLMGNGPTALQEIKTLFGDIAGRPIDESVTDLTAVTIARVRATEEAKEGFSAFFDKRPATWSAK